MFICRIVDGEGNSRPTATRLREMSMPGIGHELQAYSRSRIALRATRMESHLLVMILRPFGQVPIDALNHHRVVVVP
jgi:hypothetical protein